MINNKRTEVMEILKVAFKNEISNELEIKNSSIVVKLEDGTVAKILTRDLSKNVNRRV